ncbi:MAG TPA: tetratricopeptide repeat protein [Candidatus Acidoferrales bacterium]|nr:tetratricopeptide repeat protein [Candidatus Acidoferrales bacterium]
MLYRTWIIAAALWLTTVALYWPVTHHEFLDYDDDLYVTSNTLAQHGLAVDALKWELLHPVCGNWHPVTMLSHLLDCQLFGLNPWGHHLTSLLLHALNTVLVFVLFQRLTGAFWRSAWVAALFAWHPLHVESVAWIAERKDVLSTCFGLFALLAYVGYARGWGDKNLQPGAPPDRVVIAICRSPAYWLACLFLALGLLSKPMLVTWPFVFLLLDYWPLERLSTSRWRSLVVEKIPFFVLAAAVSVLTLIVQRTSGAMTALAQVPLPMRCANALVCYCRYVFAIFWPAHLSVFYPYPKDLPPVLVILAALFLAAVSGAVLMARKRWPFLPVGWFWFAGTLTPVLGLVQVGAQAMADRYTYFPSLGVFLIVVWGVFELSRRWRWRAVAGSLAAATLLLCCATTRSQIGYWRNSVTLFTHALEVTADNAVSRNNLGAGLVAEGKNDAAIGQFQVALRLQPDSVEAHYNLGTLLAGKGQTNQAVAELEEAIRLRPDYSQAHNNLGILLSALGRTNQAAGEFEQAVRLDPEFADAHFNLGNLLAQCGRVNDASNEFLDAARLNPRDAETRRQLGDLLAKNGQTGSAIVQYQQAIRLNPKDADTCYKLGNLLARTGLKDDAIRLFQQALRARPAFAEAHNNLGSLLSAQGRLPEAIGQFQLALRIKADYPDAHYNLGNAFLKEGQLGQAIGEYQAVINLSPEFAAAHLYLGVALAEKKQTDEAITQFQEYLRLRPGDALAHNKFGVALGEAGRTDDAILQFQEALRLNPGYAEASSNLARALELKAASGPH